MGCKTLLTEDALLGVDSYIDKFMPDYEGKNDEAVPTRAGLALHIGVSRQVVDKWLKEGREILSKGDSNDIKARFVRMVEVMDTRQEVNLISGALKKNYDAKTSALLLSRFGYSEKQQIDHSSNDGSMTPKSFSPAEYKAAQDAMKDQMEGLD